MTAYVVTAGYVTVETERPGGGRAAIDVPRGQILPGDVSQEQINWELKLRTIEPVGEPKANPAETPDEPPAPPAVDEMPSGMSVAGTLTWVGGNPARAWLALTAEQGATSPRATLIDRLGKLLPAE
jgi:hypothetical protein